MAAAADCNDNTTDDGITFIPPPSFRPSVGSRSLISISISITISIISIISIIISIVIIIIISSIIISATRTEQRRRRLPPSCEPSVHDESDSPHRGRSH